MKTLRLSLLLLSLGASVYAQTPPAPVADVAPGAVQRTPEELDQLLGPIALYPDALIAIILPAAAVPTDVVLAARHLRENPGDRTQIEHRAWDESVKSLTNYPEVLMWMDENLHWTRQVGEAFSVQPADVMQAIQRLRAKARAAGTLVDTPQQQVIAEPQVIRIVPAQPDVIYVPRYEPDVVFVDRPVYYAQPFLTFGIGVPVGSWLAFDCDWRRHTIWVGDRHRRWSGHDWRNPVVTYVPSRPFVGPPPVRQWRPPPQALRPSVTVTYRSRPEVARPAPLGVATARPYTPRDFSWTDRRNHPGGAETPAVAPALPRHFNSTSRNEAPGPRPSPQPPRAATAAPTTPAVAPQMNVVTTPPVVAPPAPSPNLQPLPQSRRGGNWSHDGENRRPQFRSSEAPQSAPSVAPALPVARAPHNASAPPVMGPTVQPQRSYSHVNSTPAVAPALPMHNRSSAPAIGPTVAPSAPAPAPQAAPPAQQQSSTPPQSRSGGESRGHRGAAIER